MKEPDKQEQPKPISEKKRKGEDYWREVRESKDGFWANLPETTSTKTNKSKPQSQDNPYLQSLERGDYWDLNMELLAAGAYYQKYLKRPMENTRVSSVVNSPNQQKPMPNKENYWNSLKHLTNMDWVNIKKIVDAFFCYIRKRC